MLYSAKAYRLQHNKVHFLLQYYKEQTQMMQIYNLIHSANIYFHDVNILCDKQLPSYTYFHVIRV